MNEQTMIQGLQNAFSELGVIQFLGINEEQSREFILNLRSIHPPNTFTSWRLCVDHFQFASLLLLSTSFGEKCSTMEIAALMCYLLALYSDPQQVDAVKRTKFTIETSGKFTTAASLFTAAAYCSTNPLSKMSSEERWGFWNIIYELQDSENSSPVSLVALLARVSYTIRDTNVFQSWLNMKVNEEFNESAIEDYEEIRKEIFSFEYDTVCLPLFQEATSVDPAMEDFLERVQMNYEFATN